MIPRQESVSLLTTKILNATAAIPESGLAQGVFLMTATRAALMRKPMQIMGPDTSKSWGTY